MYPRQPAIIPMRRPLPGQPTNRITTTTYLQLVADYDDESLYFTTDGTDPCLRHGLRAAPGTHLYKAPFKLRPGSRIVKAMSVNRHAQSSPVARRSFHVEHLVDDSSETVSLVSDSDYTYTPGDSSLQSPEVTPRHNSAPVDYHRPVTARYPTSAYNPDHYDTRRDLLHQYRHTYDMNSNSTNTEGSEEEDDMENNVDNYFTQRPRQQQISLDYERQQPGPYRPYTAPEQPVGFSQSDILLREAREKLQRAALTQQLAREQLQQTLAEARQYDHQRPATHQLYRSEDYAHQNHHALMDDFHTAPAPPRPARERRSRSREKKPRRDVQQSVKPAAEASVDTAPPADITARPVAEEHTSATEPTQLAVPVQVPATKTTKTEPPLQPVANKGNTKDKGRLNFVNDSGTQINFWGVPPSEVLDKVKIKGMDKVITPAPAEASAAATRPNDNRAFDNQHITPTMATQARDSPPRPQPRLTRPTVKREYHTEQRSFIGDCFRNLFGTSNNHSHVTTTNMQKCNVSFDDIRRQFTETGDLWEDPDFLAGQESSLFYNTRPNVDGDIVWKRPSELAEDPQLVVEGASRFDVCQGELGDCWLLSAVAALSTDRHMFDRVVPADQDFGEQYCGAFRFRIWQYGKWTEVVVDDRLPTVNNRLLYMRSAERNEFWSPLLEKAFAKLHGSYEALTGGQATEAMEDLTGGVVEKYNFRNELPADLFHRMIRARARGSLLSVCIDPDGAALESQLDNGLIVGHAYSITDIRCISLSEGEDPLELLRIRNPWGNSCEWTGPWSDGSDEWMSLPASIKATIGLRKEHDGEFWMLYTDFATHFHILEICHLGPETFSEHTNFRWHSNAFLGCWRSHNAGGCRNFPTYCTNPQYLVTVEDVDDDDDEQIGTLIVAVMQINRRAKRKLGIGYLTIGYDVYKVPDGTEEILDQDFFANNSTAATSPSYVNSREVCGRHRLLPGRYCIIPTTFEPNQPADFMVRTFTEKRSSARELNVATLLVQPQRSSRVSSVLTAGALEETHRQFLQLCDDNETIGPSELRELFSRYFSGDSQHGQFDWSLCKKIIAMFDNDYSQTLGFDEFSIFWQVLDEWQALFQHHDVDHNGYFNSHEMRTALKSSGFQLSNQIVCGLTQKHTDNNGKVTFVEFVACLVALKTLTDTYLSKSSEPGWADISLEEFLLTTTY